MGGEGGIRQLVAEQGVAPREQKQFEAIDTALVVFPHAIQRPLPPPLLRQLPRAPGPSPGALLDVVEDLVEGGGMDGEGRGQEPDPVQGQ
jgi:hypothetical protein